MITKEDLLLIEELTTLVEDKKFKKLKEKVDLILHGIELQEELNKNSEELQKFAPKK